MSYVEALLVRKATRAAIVRLERVTQRFPKRHKHALGVRVGGSRDRLCVVDSARAAALRSHARIGPQLDRLGGRKLGQLHTRYGARYVVAQRYGARLATRLVQQGYRVALAVERPWRHGRLKHREVGYLVEPAPGGAVQGDCA